MLTYAYKQMPLDELREIMERDGMDIESQEFKDEILFDLTYLATFGLHDPIREDVKQSIQLIKYGTVMDDAEAADEKP